MVRKVPTPEELEKLQRADMAPQIDEFLEVCIRQLRKKHNLNGRDKVSISCKEFSPAVIEVVAEMLRRKQWECTIGQDNTTMHIRRKYLKSNTSISAKYPGNYTKYGSTY